jgi:hypothetical protein
VIRATCLVLPPRRAGGATGQTLPCSRPGYPFGGPGPARICSNTDLERCAGKVEKETDLAEGGGRKEASMRDSLLSLPRWEWGGGLASHENKGGYSKVYQ